jgi:hypothetical protein
MGSNMFFGQGGRHGDPGLSSNGCQNMAVMFSVMRVYIRKVLQAVKLNVSIRPEVISTRLIN